MVQTKLFSAASKFLNISAKPFFLFYVSVHLKNLHVNTSSLNCMNYHINFCRYSLA